MPSVIPSFLIGSLLLLFVPWTYDPFIRPKLMATALIVIWWIRRERDEFGRCTDLDRWTKVFAGFYLVSLIFSFDKPAGILGYCRMPIQGLLELFLYWQCFQIGLEDGRREEIPVLAVVFALPMCVYAVMQRLNLDFHHIYAMPIGRAISTQGSPVYLASMIILVFPVIFLNVSKYPAISTIILLGAWAAGTRSVWLGISVSIAYLYGKRRPWAALGGVILAGIGVLWLLKRPTSFISDLERFKTWNLALHAWLMHPWLGWGPDNFYEAFRALRGPDFIALMKNQKLVQGEAHNIVLQSLVTIGGLGTAALAVLLISLFEAIPDGKEQLPVKAGLLGLLAQSMFEPLSFPTIALAALLAGSAVRREGFKFKPKWLPSAGAAAAALACMLFVSDVFFEYGQYQSAILKKSPVKAYSWMVLLDPLNLEHTAEYNVSLFNRGIAGERWALIRAAAVGWVQVKLHPRDPLAHQLYADSALMAGDFETAKDEILMAAELDPVFPIIQERKRAILSAAQAAQRAGLLLAPGQ